MAATICTTTQTVWENGKKVNFTEAGLTEMKGGKQSPILDPEEIREIFEERGKPAPRFDWQAKIRNLDFGDIAAGCFDAWSGSSFYRGVAVLNTANGKIHFAQLGNNEHYQNRDLVVFHSIGEQDISSLEEADLLTEEEIKAGLESRNLMDLNARRREALIDLSRDQEERHIEAALRSL